MISRILFYSFCIFIFVFDKLRLFFYGPSRFEIAYAKGCNDQLMRREKERQEIDDLVAAFMKKYPELDHEKFGLSKIVDNVDLFLAVDWASMMFSRFCRYKELEANAVLVWHENHSVSLKGVIEIPRLSIHDEIARSLQVQHENHLSFKELTDIADIVTAWILFALERQPKLMKDFSTYILKYPNGEKVLSIVKNNGFNRDCDSGWRV